MIARENYYAVLGVLGETDSGATSMSSESRVPKGLSSTSFASSPETRVRMQAVRRRDTPAELAVRSLLHRRGLRFRVDSAPVPGLRRRADIVFASARVAVFIDGCFWHGCPKHATWPKANSEWWRAKISATILRDRDTDQHLEDAGWAVLRAWTHEAAVDVAERVDRLVAIRRLTRSEAGRRAAEYPKT
jgi:DNA mismatch endonuclease, patch repair protein